MLRKTTGPKRDKVIEQQRKLHNKELCDLYSSPNIIWVIKKNEIGQACGMYGTQERCIQGFGGEK